MSSARSARASATASSTTSAGGSARTPSNTTVSQSAAGERRKHGRDDAPVDEAAVGDDEHAACGAARQVLCETVRAALPADDSRRRLEGEATGGRGRHAVASRAPGSASNAAAASRSSVFTTLPIVFRGSSATMWTRFGTL